MLTLFERIVRRWRGRADPADRPGRVRYTAVLEELHRTLEPGLYVEIGVRDGRSLRLARGRAIGIDPANAVSDPLPPLCSVVPATSDEFFATMSAGLLSTPVDLAFIDGHHHFEYALRDFMNLERAAAPTGIIVFDDAFPNEPAQGERVRRTAIWMGDVWKIARILRDYRPDLTCLPVDVATGGLLIVAGLDSRSTVLRNAYDEIVERFAAPPFHEVPHDVLARTGALDAGDSRIGLLAARLRELRHGGDDPSLVHAAIVTICERPSASQRPSGSAPSGRMS